MLRLPVTFLRYLLVLIAVTIVTSLQTVGIALMLAMLGRPPPPLTADASPALHDGDRHRRRLQRHRPYLSYYANIASGPAMVLVATSIFILVFLFTAAWYDLAAAGCPAGGGDAASRSAGLIIHHLTRGKKSLCPSSRTIDPPHGPEQA